MKNCNGKVMHCSLALQPFSFITEYVRGSVKVGIDVASAYSLHENAANPDILWSLVILRGSSC